MTQKDALFFLLLGINTSGEKNLRGYCPQLLNGEGKVIQPVKLRGEQGENQFRYTRKLNLPSRWKQKFLGCQMAGILFSILLIYKAFLEF